MIFEPATRHVVRVGDSMARITRVHRFRDWRTIHGHASNADLVKTRSNPNLFALGDALFIPEKRLRVEESCATARRHVFEVSQIPCFLRIKLRLPQTCAFRFVIDEKEVRSGTVADGELLEEQVDPLAKSGSLTLWREEEEEPTPENGYTLRIDIGALSAIEAVHGGAGRLTNLGFHRSALPETEVDPDTAVSIARFQASVPTAVTGAYGADVEKDLKEAHDVA